MYRQEFLVNVLMPLRRLLPLAAAQARVLRF